jgi:tetratricopeptide (TPR) repeat protein
LETLRAYALERLQRSGETGTACRMHAQYYASYSREHVGRRLQGGGWFAELKTEAANLRGAMKWCIDEGNDAALGASIAEAFAWFAYDPMLFEEAAHRCENALAAFGPNPPAEYEAVLQLGRSRCYTYLAHAQPALIAAERATALLRALDDRARLTYALGYLAEALWQLGRADESAEVAEEACALARDNPHALGAALTGKARTTHDLEKKREVLREALQAYRTAGSESGVCHLLLHLGECAFEGGDAAGALDYARQCIALTRDDIDWQRHLVALMRGNAAAYALALGEIETARSFARASLDLAKRMNDRRRIAFGLQHLAGVSMEGGDVRRAAQLLGASDAHLGPHSAPRLYTERSGYEKAMEKLRAALGETELQVLLAEGRRWSTERAVEAAMEV